jgi:sec-independent protein translocase protein TatA
MDQTILALFNQIGPTEVILILLAVLLLFGGKKLPELARGLGKGLRLFKDEVAGVKKELEEDLTQPPADQNRPVQQSGQDATKDQGKP